MPGWWLAWSGRGLHVSFLLVAPCKRPNLSTSPLCQKQTSIAARTHGHPWNGDCHINSGQVVWWGGWIHCSVNQSTGRDAQAYGLGLASCAPMHLTPPCLWATLDSINAAVGATPRIQDNTVYLEASAWKVSGSKAQNLPSSRVCLSHWWLL